MFVFPSPGARALFAVGMTVVTALLATGCASVSEPNANRVEKDTESRYARILRQQVGFYENPDIDPRIEQITGKLRRQLPRKMRDFRVHVLDHPMPNAFAAPDRTLFLSRGLIALLNSDDALAGILAHEISHITEKHHVKQKRRSVIPGLLTLPGKAVGRVVSKDVGELINAPIENVGRAYLAGYSRSQETEADLEGIRLAAKAGYRPEAMAEVLIQMEAFIEITFNHDSEGGFFDTHPTTPDRIDEIFTRAIALKEADRDPPHGTRDRAFLLLLDGLVVGPNPADGRFYENTYRHPVLDYALTLPVGWKYVNTPATVGGFAPDGNAAVFLGPAGFGTDCSRYARQTRDSFYNEFRIQPVRDAFFDLNGNDAHILTYRERTNGDVTSILFLWVEQNGRIYQIIGVSPEAHREEILACATSFRALTREEQQAFTGFKIRLAEAYGGESFADFSERTGNVFSPEATAAMNGYAPDNVFQGGELLKYVREEPYRPR